VPLPLSTPDSILPIEGAVAPLLHGTLRASLGRSHPTSCHSAIILGPLPHAGPATSQSVPCYTASCSPPGFPGFSNQALLQGSSRVGMRNAATTLPR
jgi:hypothetical protein